MPFVGCPASPRRQQSSPGHAPCEHNWPLRRPGRSRCWEPRRQVVRQAAATAFRSHRCRGYGLHPEEQQGCIAVSRGGHWGAACNTPGVAGDAAGGCSPGTAPSAALLPASCAGRVPKHTQGAPKVHGHLPAATTPPWPPRKGGRGSSLPGGSSWQSKAVTKRQHFGSACSEV